MCEELTATIARWNFMLYNGKNRIDGHYRILKENRERKAYLLRVSDNKLIKTELHEGEFIL